jgi:hypothetical protein
MALTLTDTEADQDVAQGDELDRDEHNGEDEHRGRLSRMSSEGGVASFPWGSTGSFAATFEASPSRAARDRSGERRYQSVSEEGWDEVDTRRAEREGLLAVPSPGREASGG